MGSLAHAVVLLADCSEGFLRQTHSVYCDFFRKGFEIKLFIITAVAVVMPHLRTNKNTPKNTNKKNKKRRKKEAAGRPAITWGEGGFRARGLRRETAREQRVAETARSGEARLQPSSCSTEGSLCVFCWVPPGLSRRRAQKFPKAVGPRGEALVQVTRGRRAAPRSRGAAPAPACPGIKCPYVSTGFIRQFQLRCQFFMGNNFSPHTHQAVYYGKIAQIMQYLGIKQVVL